MKSTALGAENIIFISDAHEKFYYEKLQEVRYQDVYHKALCYCLGINGDTRKNADRIYNFKTGSVKTKCLHEGWQTSGSLKVVRMAFNLYCNSTPSVWDYEDAEEQVNECRQYTVEDIFCCAYAPYFWQAIQIRYPEYVVYNQKLHAMLGGMRKYLCMDMKQKKTGKGNSFPTNCREVQQTKDMEINEKIRYFRKQRGISQELLAERTGINVNTIRKYEIGIRKPKVEQLKKIADGLEISAIEFLDIEIENEADLIAMLKKISPFFKWDGLLHVLEGEKFL